MEVFAPALKATVVERELGSSIPVPKIVTIKNEAVPLIPIAILLNRAFQVKRIPRPPQLSLLF